MVTISPLCQLNGGCMGCCGHDFISKKKIKEVIDKNTKISVKGRHDPCVGIRAVPIGEAMLNCVLLDHYLLNRAQTGKN